jgi:hypothetical protein
MPKSGKLAIRSPCPKCGIVNKYMENIIEFFCPYHGSYSVDTLKDFNELSYNCQLINLIIALFYQNHEKGYIQICGSDYAGFWQEQMIWRHLESPILIMYSSLIVDWSGYKLSKSIYLIDTNYEYLKKSRFRIYVII